MKCQLIQSPVYGPHNQAEEDLLRFLCNLPENFYVYRELQIAPEYADRVCGLKKKQPDFVVIAPEIGVLSIETKDWNLDRNRYEWQNQYKVTVTRQDGSVDEIDNPATQADGYQHALEEQLKGITIFVNSIVALPRICRNDFLDKVENISALKNPSSRFYLDLTRTLFKEDLDANWSHPERLLEKIVRLHKYFQPSTAIHTETAHRRLLPPLYRIGDYTKRQAGQKRLKKLTQEQLDWVFNQDPRKNYLLDVAGSGKTNALISKALYLVGQAGSGAAPTILLTTYSTNLEINIRRIFAHKVFETPEKDRQRYREAIHIASLPALMEEIVASFYGMPNSAYRSQSPGNETSQQYEQHLQEHALEILSETPERYRRFDYIFVDEIQDFTDPFLGILTYLARNRNFFFVGDLGQKIYQRSYNLARLGFLTEKLELEKTYKMFRTPRYIAELATRFILSNASTRQELVENGYSENFQFPNTLENGANFWQSNQPEQELALKITEILGGSYQEDDLLVITSQQSLARCEEFFPKQGIHYHIGESEKGGQISLTDFMNVKGLEKEVVLICGIEDLYERSHTASLFSDEETRWQEEQLSRRKVYVALTRSLEHLHIYYRDPTSIFLQELLKISRDILQKRQRGLYGISV
jgi:superfamily I DNA/RNA helicase